jgi:hypothetical protein
MDQEQQNATRLMSTATRTYVTKADPSKALFVFYDGSKVRMNKGQKTCGKKYIAVLYEVIEPIEQTQD